MILGENNKKPNIDYPCKWTFKVIGDDVDTMINSMEKAVEGLEKEITSSNVSTRGNYFSMNLIVTINSEEERYSIYDRLSKSPNIKYIL